MDLKKLRVFRQGFYLSLVLVFSSILFAAEKISQEVDLTNNTELEFNNLRGSIVIKGWDKNKMSIEGVLDEESTGLVIEEKHQRLLVKVKMPVRLSPKKGSKLVIFVPKNSSLKARGVSSSWLIQNVNNISVDSVSGAIEIANSSGNVNLGVVSAPVKVMRVKGTVGVNSLSGKIESIDNSGKVTLSTVEGELHLTQPIIDFARLSSVNGKIYIDGKLAAKGKLSVTSVDGDVFLKIGGSKDLNCQLQALHGGSIKNYLKMAGKESNQLYGKHFSLIIGEGNALVEATTISGTINLQ